MSRYQIILQALPRPYGPSAIHRLRSLLKSAIRAYGLRCVECRTLADPETAANEYEQNSSILGEKSTPPKGI